MSTTSDTTSTLRHRCPDCGRESEYHESTYLGEAAPSTKAVVVDDPHEYDRDNLEVVIDSATGHVLREPIQYRCKDCGTVWYEEDSRTVEEVREWHQ